MNTVDDKCLRCSHKKSKHFGTLHRICFVILKTTGNYCQCNHAEYDAFGNDIEEMRRLEVQSD